VIAQQPKELETSNLLQSNFFGKTYSY